MNEVGILSALAAGLLSFLSPCVLPLVPGYISMLSGIGMEQLRAGEAPRGGLLASALAFVAGFSAVFIGLGASASAVGKFLGENKAALAPVAGAVVVLFGLHLIGWLGEVGIREGLALGAGFVGAGVLAMLRPEVFGRAPRALHFFSVSIIFLLGPFLAKWMNRDFHFRNLGGQPGTFSGFLMGFAFAFGWTPCIGPILAGVLALAADAGTVGKGVALLAVYSAGLAIPFLLTAVGIGRFLTFYQDFRKHLHTVEVCSGVLLLGVGGLLFMNRLTWLAGKLSFFNLFVF